MTARSFSYAPAVLVALWTTSTVGLGPDIDPTWLSVNAAAKTVRFQLIAGLTGVNGALNFNGFSDGGLTLVVPAGWQTEIDFRNHDGMLPHSAEIIAPQTPLPTQPVPPAIAGVHAETYRRTRIGSHRHDTFHGTACGRVSHLVWGPRSWCRGHVDPLPRERHRRGAGALGHTGHAFLVLEDSRPIADLPLHLQLQDLLALGYSLVSRVAYVTYIGLALRRADAEPVSRGAAAYARFRRRAAFLMYHDGVAFVAVCILTRGTLDLPLPLAWRLAGAALVALGVGVKLWATAALGADGYYWRDFFEREIRPVPT